MAATISATDAELPKPVNVIMQMTLLKNAKAVCPHFAGSVPAQVDQHRGSLTANWRRIENLTPTTTALAELTTTASAFARDSDVASVTDVTKAVAKYGQYLILNEEADLANFDNQMDGLIAVLGISGGRSINMVQRDEMEDNSGIDYVGGGASDGSVTSAITKAAIQKTVNGLARSDAMPFTAMTTGSQNIGTAPILPGYWAANHPDVSIDVEGLAGFKSVETYAGQVQIATGEYGLVPVAGYAVRFIQTSDASIDTNSGGTTGSTGLRGSTDIDLYSTPIWGQNAVGSLGFGMQNVREVYRAGDTLPTMVMINKSRGSMGAADPFDEISTMAWKAWSASKVLDTTWIQTIRSGATDVS